MSKSTSLKKYLLEKCLIGNGIVNGIVNAIIFYLLHLGSKDKLFQFSDIIGDLGATSLILGVILAAIVHPLTVKDIKKGKITQTTEVDKIAKLLPKKKGLAYLAIGALTFAIITPLSALITLIPSFAPLTVTTMGIFKGVMCSIAGAIAGYLTISYTRNHAVIPAEENSNEEVAA